MVNETLARRMWQTPANAIGKRLRSRSGDWRTVIGVARDVKYARLSEEPRPYVHFPLLQSHNPRSPSTREPAALLRDARSSRSTLHAFDPQMPIVLSVMLAEQTRVALSIYQLAAGTLTMFGAMTILLAAIGIYGLVAYTVQQSTQEIGIRLAVGARRGRRRVDVPEARHAAGGGRRGDRPGGRAR